MCLSWQLQRLTRDACLIRCTVRAVGPRDLQSSRACVEEQHADNSHEEEMLILSVDVVLQVLSTPLNSTSAE